MAVLVSTGELAWGRSDRRVLAPQLYVACGVSGANQPGTEIVTVPKRVATPPVEMFRRMKRTPCAFRTACSHSTGQKDRLGRNDALTGFDPMTQPPAVF